MNEQVKEVLDLVINDFPSLGSDFQFNHRQTDEIEYRLSHGYTPVQIWDFLYSERGIDYCFDVDEECVLDTRYGFVMDKEGKIYHLHRQYEHGAVVAALHPDVAIKNGYFAPRKERKHNLFGVYEYQDFGFEVIDDLGYITFSAGHWYALHHTREHLNEKQVANLKKWLYNMDMLDMKIVTDFGDYYANDVIIKMSAKAQKNKLNGYRPRKVNYDVKLIEPDDSPF